jgi:ABC-2 type transport system permease protein
MRNFVQNMQLLLALARIALLTELEYRFSFMLKVLGIFTNSLTFLVIWWLYFQQFPNMNGWTIRETALMLAISSATFGFVLMFARGLSTMARSISRGEFDYYLSLPADPLWLQAISRMDMAGLGDVLFSLLVVTLFAPLDLAQIGLFLLLLCCSSAVFAGFLILTQSLAFYLGNFEDAAEQLWWSLGAFGLYPQSAYTGILRVVTLTIFPAFFITTLPVELLINFSWPLLGLLLCFCLLFFRLALAVFYHGLKRYESGNLMNVLR